MQDIYVLSVRLLTLCLEIRDGHIPVNASKRFGCWTSEEFQKFSIAADSALQVLISYS